MSTKIFGTHIGDCLKTEREPRNHVDKYAVAVMQKKNLVVGHLKRKICEINFIFFEERYEFM